MSNGNEIEECLDRLIKLCSREKVPVMLAIQDTSNSIRSMSANEHLAIGTQFRHMKIAIRSNNIDHFLRDVIRDAQHNGHRSLFLRAMGIPEEPAS